MKVLYLVYDSRDHYEPEVYIWCPYCHERCGESFDLDENVSDNVVFYHKCAKSVDPHRWDQFLLCLPPGFWFPDDRQKEQNYCYREIKQEELPEYCKFTDEDLEYISVPKFLEVGLIAITDILSMDSGWKDNHDFDILPDDTDEIKTKKITQRRKCIYLFLSSDPYKEIIQFLEDTKEYASDGEEAIKEFYKKDAGKDIMESEYDNMKSEAFKALIPYHKIDPPVISLNAIPYSTDHAGISLYYKGFCCRCGSHFNNKVWGD